MIIYGHPTCSTVKKALNYLNNKGIKYTYYNLKEVTPSPDELKEYHLKSGLDIKRFFNTSGMQYRELNIKDKLPDMSLEECYELLSSNGMIIKRPLLITDNKILLGFKEQEYEGL